MRNFFLKLENDPKELDDAISYLTDPGKDSLELAPVIVASEYDRGDPNRVIPFGELAGTQDGQRIHLESTSSVTGPSWPNACHICEIELTPQTGEVRVDTYSSVNDVGRVVNPMIVVGQLDGGAIQGIGQALIEAVVYDPESGQLLTGSLMDYAAPRADITPVFRNEMDQSTPCKNNPLGVKGVGELGTIGATPCVVNAIADALARNGHGALTPQLQMPLTSARLWDLLQPGH